MRPLWSCVHRLQHQPPGCTLFPGSWFTGSTHVHNPTASSVMSSYFPSAVRAGLLVHPTLLQEAVKDARRVPHAALHSMATSACTQGPANIPSKWHKLTFERGQFVRA